MLPRLIHPIPVQIEQIQRITSIVDDDFREPIQSAIRGPRVTVLGQISWIADEQLGSTEYGALQESSGYILFRRADLRAAGLDEIRQNDRFVSIGSGDNETLVDLYVTRVQQMGHYYDQGGATIVRAWFKDRWPSKQNKGGNDSPIVIVPGAAGAAWAEWIQSSEGAFTVPSSSVVGQAVYPSGNRTAEIADATTTTKAPAVGLILEKTSATRATLVYEGKVTGFTGLTPGSILFLGSNGSLIGADSLPLVSGSVTQRMAFAVAADEIVLHPCESTQM